MVCARVVKLVNALDLGSSPPSGWGFNSPLSHQIILTHRFFGLLSQVILISVFSPGSRIGFPVFGSGCLPWALVINSCMCQRVFLKIVDCSASQRFALLKYLIADLSLLSISTEWFKETARWVMYQVNTL